MSNTPETDALIRGMHEDVSIEGPTVENINVFINHARKLEHERNEAMAYVQDEIRKHFDTIERTEKICAERDQLRKVADELAYCLKNPAIFQRMESIDAMCSYNSLPHVIERNKSV